MRVKGEKAKVEGKDACMRRGKTLQRYTMASKQKMVVHLLPEVFGIDADYRWCRMESHSEGEYRENCERK